MILPSRIYLSGSEILYLIGRKQQYIFVLIEKDNYAERTQQTL